MEAGIAAQRSEGEAEAGEVEKRKGEGVVGDGYPCRCTCSLTAPTDLSISRSVCRSTIYQKIMRIGQTNGGGPPMVLTLGKSTQIRDTSGPPKALWSDIGPDLI